MPYFGGFEWFSYYLKVLHHNCEDIWDLIHIPVLFSIKISISRGMEKEIEVYINSRMLFNYKKYGILSFCNKIDETRSLY